MCATMTVVRGRWFVRIAAVMLSFSLSPGCGPKPENKPKVETAKAETSTTPTAPGTMNVAKESASPPSPEEFEKKFVQSLADGKAVADDLTPALRKKIAHARAGAEEDQKLGYNPVAVEAFLKGKLFPNPLTLAVRDGTIAYFSNAQTPSLIKLVYLDGAGWKVDWLHSVAIPAAGIDFTAKNHGGIAAARCFLEPLLGGDLLLTEAAMSQAWKVKVAGSDNPSDKALGYSRGQLQNYIRQWRDTHKGYRIDKSDFDTDSGTVGGEFTGGMTQAFKLKVLKDSSGEWLAEELKVE